MRAFDFVISASLSELESALHIKLLDSLTEPLFERYEGEVIPSLCDETLILDCTIEAQGISDAVREVWGFVTRVVQGDAAQAGTLAPSGATLQGVSIALPDPQVEMAYSGLMAA